MSLISTEKSPAKATVRCSSYLEGYLLSRAGYANLCFLFPAFEHHIESMSGTRLEKARRTAAFVDKKDADAALSSSDVEVETAAKARSSRLRRRLGGLFARKGGSRRSLAKLQVDVEAKIAQQYLQRRCRCRERDSHGGGDSCVSSVSSTSSAGRGSSIEPGSMTRRRSDQAQETARRSEQPEGAAASAGRTRRPMTRSTIGSSVWRNTPMNE